MSLFQAKQRRDRAAPRPTQRCLVALLVTVCGTKLHVVYDPDLNRPVYTAVTTACVNNLNAAKAMPIEPRATYVFDLGYHDDCQ